MFFKFLWETNNLRAKKEPSGIPTYPLTMTTPGFISLSNILVELFIADGNQM